MITSKRLIKNSQEFSSEIAFSIKDNDGEWENNTWSEFCEYAFSIGKSLIKLGIDFNDKISIYSYNRKEWTGIYAATQMIRGVAVGVYHTCSSDEVEWIVGNSDSKIVFVGHNPNDNDDPQKMPINRLHEILDKLEHVEKVVVFDGIDMINHEKIISVSYTHLTLPTKA